VDVRIGIVQTPKELEIELGDDVDRDQVLADIESALSGAGGAGGASGAGGAGGAGGSTGGGSTGGGKGGAGGKAAEAAEGGERVLWLTDRRGRRVAVPVAKVAYVEVGAPANERRVGFGAP